MAETSVYYFYHTRTIVVARSPMLAVAYYMEYQGEDEYIYRNANRQSKYIAWLSVNGSPFIGVQRLGLAGFKGFKGFKDLPEGTIRPLLEQVSEAEIEAAKALIQLSVGAPHS